MAHIDELRSHLEREKARLASFDKDPGLDPELIAAVAGHIKDTEKQISELEAPAKSSKKFSPQE